jgi:lysophospholipase L1-like esterase
MNYKTYRKRTAYTPDKVAKANNFEFLNKNYCAQGQTILLGDSITEMYTHTELFADYTAKTGLAVYNRGISGDTSDRLFERLETSVLNIKPKNIVLLIGTNDIGVGVDVELINQYIDNIIIKTKSALPNVNFVLLAVYPVNRKVSKSVGRRFNEKIANLNKLLVETAKRQNVKFVDMTDKLSDSQGNLDVKYTFDGLHINAQAFELVTQALLKVL